MAHDLFQQVLLTALGPVLQAAGYSLDEVPVQWSGGLFRFRRRYDETLDLAVAFQLLAHPECPARFQVILARVSRTLAQPALSPASMTLSRLLWDAFQVRVLPEADHWWVYRAVPDLGSALLEAGKLLAGYGLPWLDGTLVPPEAGSS